MDDPGGQNTDDYLKRPDGSDSTGVDDSNWISRRLPIIKKGVRAVGLLTCLYKSTNMGRIGMALSGILISCSQPHIFLFVGIRFFKTLEKI